jgi:hypothetical protein
MGRPRTLSQKVVDRIVAEKKAGRTLQEICDGLTADGVPTARGGRKWNPSVARRVCIRDEASRECLSSIFRKAP